MKRSLISLTASDITRTPSSSPSEAVTVRHQAERKNEREIPASLANPIPNPHSLTLGLPGAMASAAAAPAVHCSSPRAPLSGATSSKFVQRTSVRISQARTWPSHVSGRRPMVCAEYSDRRGGGAGDFVAGFLLGGAVFGALGYILAPQISKSLEEGDSVKDEGTAAKRPARYLEDDEGLEKTRQTLNEKIAQLNAAIDDVSAQLRTEEGLGNSNGSNVELESAA